MSGCGSFLPYLWEGHGVPICYSRIISLGLQKSGISRLSVFYKKHVANPLRVFLRSRIMSSPGDLTIKCGEHGSDNNYLTETENKLRNIIKRTGKEIWNHSENEVEKQKPLFQAKKHYETRRQILAQEDIFRANSAHVHIVPSWIATATPPAHCTPELPLSIFKSSWSVHVSIRSSWAYIKTENTTYLFKQHYMKFLF